MNAANSEVGTRNAEIEITTRVTVINGRFAINRNAHLIRMEKLKPGCNVVGCPRIPDPKTYREVYRIKKDHWDEWEDGKKTGRKRRGYSFVEVNHGMGGWGGVQPSVRALIEAASFSLFGPNTDCRIVFEGEAREAVAE